MNTIKELYYGNIQGSEFSHSKKWHEQKNITLTRLQKLESKLTEEQKELLNEFIVQLTQQHSLEREELYTYAMAIGIGLGCESKKRTEDTQ